jgi:dTDP-D-glucose 4,6-dehydratase
MEFEEGLNKVHEWFTENWEDIDKNAEFKCEGNIMTMKALVTGCAGFIGRVLVASFLS